ncbi:Fe2+-enterobactin ABC transporter substrate-binding protein [Pengzhenrongella frigida]|uniref:Fe2+-enterobactin ABC transporter substrate-binding protein n=1 Tax=Pengzhenrongella frigida TaxID=1259133 RepID=A0A4Q5MZW9_9MICO|nr:Fe2+-enterobactin ABC transporter substrate-binding protein [Cellulomonas sp. HLT2-17]RYV50493.1 Fe2+-enterobactin ABC transporter substrate-binding protein [Cellulomonas sp. HLT2-17]
MSRTSRSLGVVALTALVALGSAACSSPGPAEADATADTAASSAIADAAWPRTVTHALGETVIETAPTSIVSTSLTLTGVLLSIDAPVTGSSASTPADSNDGTGFFDWWADIAQERGVEPLYQNLEHDEEAIIAAAPDLIVVSTSGADSTADQYDALSAIAPTIVLDYSASTWQDIALELGSATGLEEQAKATVDTFDQRVAEVAGKITIPEGTVNAVVYYGDGGDTAFAKPEGSHGTLLASLGFDVVGADDAFDTSAQTRTDFAFVSLENTVTALTGETVFIISGSDTNVDAMRTTPVLANAPAVTNGQVYALGDDSFRIDYFSATQVLDVIEGLFS